MHLFFNKKGKVLIQYIEILEKIKKHLKAEKKNTKGAFNVYMHQ